MVKADETATNARTSPCALQGTRENAGRQPHSSSHITCSPPHHTPHITPPHNTPSPKAPQHALKAKVPALRRVSWSKVPVRPGVRRGFAPTNAAPSPQRTCDPTTNLAPSQGLRLRLQRRSAHLLERTQKGVDVEAPEDFGPPYECVIANESCRPGRANDQRWRSTRAVTSNG